MHPYRGMTPIWPCRAVGGRVVKIPRMVYCANQVEIVVAVDAACCCCCCCSCCYVANAAKQWRVLGTLRVNSSYRG